MDESVLRTVSGEMCLLGIVPGWAAGTWGSPEKQILFENDHKKNKGSSGYNGLQREWQP
jgi:hypothetical protein